MSDDEETGPKVNVETWVRNEGEQYKLHLRETDFLCFRQFSVIHYISSIGKLREVGIKKMGLYDGMKVTRAGKGQRLPKKDAKTRFIDAIEKQMDIASGGHLKEGNFKVK